MSVSDDVAALVSLAVERFGRLDVMFNNAGIGGGELLIHETPEETFDRIVAVDLKGVWLGIKHAVPALQRVGGGSIINTASVSALMGMRQPGRLWRHEGRGRAAHPSRRHRIRRGRHYASTPSCRAASLRR